MKRVLASHPVAAALVLLFLLCSAAAAQDAAAQDAAAQDAAAQDAAAQDAAAQDAAAQDADAQDADAQDADAQDGQALVRNPYTDDIRVRANTDSTRYRIGDWIPLRIEIEAPATWTLNMPVTDEDIVNGEFVASDDPDRTIEDERQQLRQKLTVTVFDTGRIAIGVIVRYRVPGDTTTYTAVSNSIDMQITTVELDTTQSYRDIKDVMDVSLTIWDYLMIAGIILLAALLLWFGWRWYRGRRGREEAVEEPPAPEIPPAVIALSDLSALRGQRLWQEGRHKEYQSRLTDILRTYVERRFNVPAMEHPTSEIMPDVAMIGLPTEMVDRFEHVLQTADRTKFARYTPTAEEHESGMQFAVEFVESTRDDADV